MAKEFAKPFYNSSAWKKCRRSFIASVKGLCNRCQKPGHIVHHIQELTADNISNPDITLNYSNLEYLCLDCHNKITFNLLETQNNLIFDASGDIVKIYKAPPEKSLAPEKTRPCILALKNKLVAREGGGV